MHRSSTSVTMRSQLLRNMHVPTCATFEEPRTHSMLRGVFLIDYDRKIQYPKTVLF